MLAVASPESTWLAGETMQSVKVAAAAYQALEAKQHLTLNKSPAKQRPEAAVRWIIQQTTSP
ncbi:MAG: hypothetical protein VB912_11555, partial [Pirellulaceae bacterium]